MTVLLCHQRQKSEKRAFLKVNFYLRSCVTKLRKLITERKKEHPVAVQLFLCSNLGLLNQQNIVGLGQFMSAG